MFNGIEEFQYMDRIFVTDLLCLHSIGASRVSVLQRLQLMGRSLPGETNPDRRS